MKIRPVDIDSIPSSVQAYIVDLETRLGAEAMMVKQQSAELAHNRKIFETASVAAKIGVWECTLQDSALHWSDGVYDIFELPRGSNVARGQILSFYPEASRAKLDAVRAKAIETRSGFTCEFEIITAKARKRWLRITATVESEEDLAVRIFGIKQDITEEKDLLDRTRYLAEFDILTGLANRTQFQATLSRLDERVPDHRSVSALLLIDIDKFKQINDTFGHVRGDQCLIETANQLNEVCPDADLIARIGGDEFAVLLQAGLNREAVETVGQLIVESFANKDSSADPSLWPGVSVGIAEFAGQTASELFVQADCALYAAKDAGRGTFRTFEKGIERLFNLPRTAA